MQMPIGLRRKARDDLLVLTGFQVADDDVGRSSDEGTGAGENRGIGDGDEKL